MNIGWMKKTLQVEILSKDNGYVFSYTKDWLYKHRNRFEYVFHEVDDGKDVYYSNYDIADDGTITIETSGGGSGGSGTTLYGPYILSDSNNGDGYTINAGETRNFTDNEIYDISWNPLVWPTESVQIVVNSGNASSGNSKPILSHIIDNGGFAIRKDGDNHISPYIAATNLSDATATEVITTISFYTIDVELQPNDSQ